MQLYQRKPDDKAPMGQPDPFIFKDQGRYYLYATGLQGTHLFSSDHLTKGWRYDGVCLEMPGQRNCWAPSVIKIDQTYYMYYSSVLDTDKDEHSQRLRVATADSPSGPFIYQKDLMPPFSIDSHAVQTDSGLYMFYSANDYDSEFTGTYILCDKMTDPYHLEGKPAGLIYPTIHEEMYMRDRFKPGQHWYTIEGAFYFRVGTTHYLMYSGANHTNPTYFVGYSVAHGPEDADLRHLDWKKFPDDKTYAPLLSSNDKIEGLGHNSVIYDEGRHWIVYHARNIGDLETYDVDTRSARIDEIVIDGDQLTVNVTT
ncbi:MAG: glycoside hydrolase family 43 protein [Eubacteriales bacterium]|nr:glycoside hydrolase family 43 protein [Eubacteriales bacterium]